jgi:FkbH-like protein
MYRTEMNRAQAMVDSQLSYDTFLATCGIRVTIERPGEELLPRIDDIVQRTNQLNIASQRYTADELRALIHSAECDCFIVSSSDNYGSYGHVGFIVVARRGQAITIRDCMFSCRIQGKRIDEAVLAHVINQYLADGITSVQARFIASRRNAPAGDMLRRLGFQPQPGVDQVLSIVPASPRAAVDHVHVESTLMVRPCSLS